MLALFWKGPCFIQAIHVRACVGLWVFIACRLARSPEELLFPIMKVFGFVDVRQEPSKDADAVQHFVGDGRVWVGKDALSLQTMQSADRAVYECLGILFRRYLLVRKWSVYGGVECEVSEVVW